MDEQSAIQKIKKCLKLAENNPNQNEAENAMLMAQRLMALHNIEARQLNLVELENNVVDTNITDYAKMPWWKKSLSVIIGNNFKCEAYINVKSGGLARICFIGRKTDVDIATEVFHFAIKSIEYNANKYVEIYKLKQEALHGKKPRNTVSIRNQYINGFLQGLQDKFRKQIEEEQWGLVLVKDDAVMEAIRLKNLQKGNRQKVTMSDNPEAFVKGYKAGNEFEVASGFIET